jgi:hypothetical protein
MFLNIEVSFLSSVLPGKFCDSAFERAVSRYFQIHHSQSSYAMLNNVRKQDEYWIGF